MNQKTITQFCDEDYLSYAKYVVEHRAIPSVIDGLKPTARKVVYIANKIWKSGNEKPLKVFQLGGKVASDAFYHHGDSSLSQAIIGMAQSFKNSMPLLSELGQFGSLRSPDAGAPRYISTKLHPNFRLLYKDFELLSSRMEEGSVIEPEYFLPILPTVLLNGSQGIAVGFATNILNRNPLDLIDACLKMLDGKKVRELRPWIKGFSGTFEKDPENYKRWIIRGRSDVLHTSAVQIHELPPGQTFEKYDKFLTSLIAKRKISSYEDNCSNSISYTIKMTRSDLATELKRDNLIKFLKLEESMSENFTTLDEHGKLKIFKTASDIVEYFVNFRLTYYEKRKRYVINKLEAEVKLLSNRAKFIKYIIENKLKINKQPKNHIIQNLVTFKFDEIDGSFDYLLNMAIHSLTKERYEKIIKELQEKKIELIAAKTLVPKEMYKVDLMELKKVIKKDFS